VLKFMAPLLRNKLKTFPWVERKRAIDFGGASDISTIEDCNLHLVTPPSDDSIVSVLSPKGRHTRSTSLLPLAMSEADPEEIIRKGKIPQKGTSTVVPSFSDNFHNPSLQILVTVSDSPIIQIAGVSRNLIFGSFPTDSSPSILGLEGESFDTPFSPEVVKWKERGLTLEDFPTPPPIRVVATTEGETSITSSPSSLSPNA
jgi:hypothetical protein